MIRRTTIELDADLLDRARRALGVKTARATVEEALRRVADAVEEERAQRRTAQLRFLRQLPTRFDMTVLASDEMWR